MFVVDRQIGVIQMRKILLYDTKVISILGVAGFRNQMVSGNPLFRAPSLDPTGVHSFKDAVIN